MKIRFSFLLLLPLPLFAQDADAFARAVKSGKVNKVAHWVKHELHRQRTGKIITASESRYTSHAATYDSLVAFLRRQPGVEDAAWDKCMNKAAIWPGLSTIGMRWKQHDRVLERCWAVQEGIPGTINLFGWRPRVRRAREHLKYKGASECTGFVEAQKEHCGDTTLTP